MFGKNQGSVRNTLVLLANCALTADLKLEGKSGTRVAALHRDPIGLAGRKSLTAVSQCGPRVGTFHLD
jgi:hypothetical protein